MKETHSPRFQSCHDTESLYKAEILTKSRQLESMVVVWLFLKKKTKKKPLIVKGPGQIPQDRSNAS